MSVARKLGCTIFVLPEDLVEVRPKMVNIFVAAMLAVDHVKAVAAPDGARPKAPTPL